MDNMSDNSAERVRVLSFAHHRTAEMVSLTEAVKSQSGTKRIFQRLPPSMRRRAMSHNLKRIPRILREIPQRELDKQEKKTPSKRPSRKHRRRPKNLLEEYSRRKRTHVWLETHIWHAKRFHMKERWGYVIAENSTEKGIRATYQAVANHCFIQDISYYNCIELHGEENVLLHGFSRITDPSTGRSFRAEHSINGMHEGCTFLYKHDSFPFKAIAPVHFMWKCTDPENKSTGVKRQLWIWIHPGAFETIIEELLIVFGLKERKRSLDIKQESDQEVSKKKIKLTNGLPEEDSKREISQAPVKEVHLMSDIDDIVEYHNNDIKLVILKDKMVRFRLSGIESTDVLKRVLRHISLKPEQETEEGFLDEIIAKITQSKKDIVLNSDWWISYYKEDSEHAIADKQWETWRKISSSNDLTPGLVLGLTVRSPQGFLPPKRINSQSSNEDHQITSIESPIISSSELLCHSPLWNRSLKQDIAMKKIPESFYNQIKSQVNLVPGTVLELGNKEARIPILLIQKPANSNRRLGYGSGWDIILPAGWGMPFWISFLYNGARAGGVRDAQQIALEQGSLFYPNDYPDTEAARKQEELEKKEKMQAYFRRPPAKRVNYMALGIAAPFHFSWQILLNEWISQIDTSCLQVNAFDDFAVLRERRLLLHLKELCSTLHISRSPEYDQELATKAKEPFLVPVHLQLILRGSCSRNDIICFPISEDLEQYANDKKFGGPIEAIHDLKMFHEKNKERKHLVASLKKQRQKLHNKIKSLSEQNNSEKDGMIKILKAQADALHPPPESMPEITTVRKSCSRDVLGFVTNGGLSFSIGREVALGFCSLAGILKLLETKKEHAKAIVLVRSTTSPQYRFAYVSINTD